MLYVSWLKTVASLVVRYVFYSDLMSSAPLVWDCNR